MKYLILTILFINQIAFSKDMPYNIPDASKMTAEEHSLLPNIDFKGQESISGTYQFRSRENYIDSPINLYFYPDNESLERLPFLTFRAEEKAQEIYIKNSKEAAEILLGKELSAKLFSGKVKHLGGESKILIKSYTAGYECDSPSFMAILVKEIKRIKVATNVLILKYTGC